MLVQEQITAAAAAAANGGGQTMSPEELRATNPLLMLLQSMLPWVNVGQQPEYGGDEGGGGGAGDAGGAGQPPP